MSMILLLSLRNQTDAVNLTDTVSDFGKLSSAKVNWSKSEAQLGGCWEG